MPILPATDGGPAPAGHCCIRIHARSLEVRLCVCLHEQEDQRQAELHALERQLKIEHANKALFNDTDRVRVSCFYGTALAPNNPVAALAKVAHVAWRTMSAPPSGPKPLRNGHTSPPTACPLCLQTLHSKLLLSEVLAENEALVGYKKQVQALKSAQEAAFAAQQRAALEVRTLAYRMCTLVHDGMVVMHLVQATAAGHACNVHLHNSQLFSCSFLSSVHPPHPPGCRGC